MDLKQLVYSSLKRVKFEQDIKAEDLFNLLVEGKELKNGEVSLPCFTLAKTLRKSPAEIAVNLAASIGACGFSAFSEVVAVNGYVNFHFNREFIIKEILTEILQKGSAFGKSDIGNNQTVFFDFCSVNLAKYMHIGHLKTTMLGFALTNIFEFLGYNVVRLNYVGDYGTPFGKMIAGYKHWGTYEDVKARGIDAIQELYVKFNQEAEKDSKLNDEARDWFKKIEEKDKEAVEIFSWFIEIGIAEAERLCNILGVTFDSWRGENYYSDKMQPVISELEEKKLLQESEGAYIVDLSDSNLGVALVKKSDGASLYTTRDLAAVQDRYDTYHFDYGFYVTSVQQKLHFERLFKVVEKMDKPYANKLEHVYYGTISLPTGKIASRLGKQAIVSDILKAAKERALEVLAERGTKHDNMEQVAQDIAVGVIAFEVVNTEKIKDTIFDLESAIAFEGETAPYLQYTFARCNSIINKVDELIKAGSEQEMYLQHTQDYDAFNDDYFSTVKLLNRFSQTVVDCKNARETYYLTKLLLNIASDFNKFYGYNRVINESKVDKQNFELVKAVSIVLKNGLKLLGIPIIEKM
jgi:arginyl-tRNA synthetase